MWDLRMAARRLRREPAFSAIAIISLALGFGANLAIFRFVDAALIENLPVPEPNRLVRASTYEHSYPFFRDVSARTTDLFTALAARSTADLNVTIDGTTEYLSAELVSGGYFATLGVRPAAGRLLTAADDGGPGAHSVCVISYDLWMRRFGGKPDAVGRTIDLNTHVFEIVGVSERGFAGAALHRRYAMQVPMAMTRFFNGMTRDARDNRWLEMIGRLAPGMSMERAEAAIRARFDSRQYAREIPPEGLEFAEGRQGFGSLKATLQDPVLIAQLLSGCVLLIACANLASLLLVKIAGRRHELGVRAALGASRGRLIAPFAVEAALLASAGGAAGLGLAALLDRVLAAMLFGTSSREHVSMIPSGLELMLGLVLIAAAACLVGLVPALVATRGASLPGLRESSRATSRSTRWGGGLLVAQVAACLVLVFGAGLFARSLGNLRAIDLGVHPEHVAILTAGPGRSGYTRPQQREFFMEWLRRARLVPDVTSASLASIAVASGQMYAADVRVPGAVRRSGPEPNNNFNLVTPDYFRTVGLSLVAGRPFVDADTSEAPAVAIVNERFVEYYWPGQSPLGRHIDAMGDVEIVGLVRTATYQDVREEPQMIIYRPYAQEYDNQLKLHARVSGDVAAVTSGLIRAARDIDPRVPVYGVGTLEDYVNAGVANERVLNTLGTLFAGLALLIAASGLSGVVAHAAARRTREIGIRVVAGAQRHQIVRLFVRNVLGLLAAGLALGVPLALAAGRAFGSVLYRVDPFNLSTLGVAALVLTVVAVAAAAVPAIRAARVDPIVALRAE